MTKVHEGAGAGQTARATAWSTAITATTDERVFIRGAALDAAIGRMSFPSMLLLLWRGDTPSDAESDLMGACLVAAIDHGPLAPSALVARTIASTQATPMSALAGGILSFGELHGAVVSRAMRSSVRSRRTATLAAWADGVFEEEPASGRRLPGIGHRWHTDDRRAEALLESPVGSRWGGTWRPFGHSPPGSASTWGTRSPSTSRSPGRLSDGAPSSTRSTATSYLRSPGASDSPPTSSRSAIASDRMRLIDPTAAFYDGVPVPDSLAQETDR